MPESCLWPLLVLRGTCAATAGLEALSLGLWDPDVVGADEDVDDGGRETPGVLDLSSDPDND